jgi:hypothetical protein
MMFAVVAILLLGGASVEAQPWNRDTVNLDAGKDARDTSVAVDTRGIVHIAYIDSKGVVKVARKEGTGYNRDTVDAEAGQASKHPAIETPKGSCKSPIAMARALSEPAGRRVRGVQPGHG